MTQSIPLRQLIEFKNWADQVYIDYIDKLSEDQYNKIILGKSIAGIFYHIYEVMHYWTKRIDESYTDAILPEDTGRDDIIKGYQKVNNKITDFVINEKYGEFTLQWYDDDQPVTSNSTHALFNFVTHSAYHRGQLALLLRSLGLEWIKETDFNPWIYELGQNNE